jgi:polar amino acid transport system substrate-binding protein
MPGRLLILTVAALLVVEGTCAAQSPNLRPLVWAGDAEGGAPYVFRDSKDPDRYVGFEVELAAALEKELGRRIEFKQYDYKNLFIGLDRGDFDFAMNGLDVTAERQALVRFSKPYYIYKLQLVVRADEGEVKTLADCKKLGIRVGTLESTAAARLLDRLGIEKQVYDSQVTPYQDLELGRTRAVLMDLPIALYYGRSPQLKFAERPIGGQGHYAIAFRPSDEKLAGEFDAALDRLAKRGELRHIYSKWGLWNDNQDELTPPDYFYEQGDETSVNGPRALPNWSFASYFPLLIQGAWLTLQITFASMALAIVLGLPVALLRLYGPAPLRWLATAYVEFFRGVPVLLLLFLIYYGLPSLGHFLGLGSGLELGPMTAAIVGLGLNYAAYEAEIYRAGINSIAPGQWEATMVLGMSPALGLRRIILPQALRLILPPSTGDFIALFKDTSIVSGITLVELSKSYQILSTSGAGYAQIAEIGAVTATLYLVMSLPLGYLARYLEKRWALDES